MLSRWFSGQGWPGQWFLTKDTPLALCLPYHHDAWLVGLSYLVAAFAAYTAFDLISRVRDAQGLARYVWLTTAGLSLGFGIWAMHFIAMLAVEIATPIRFDLPATALSAGFAVVASALALALVAHHHVSRVRLTAAGIVLGAGIGLMHYTGMAALRMTARVYYDPGLFALSVVVAVVLSTTALAALTIVPGPGGGRQVVTRVAGSLVMGFAIVLMHYTGMFATVFYPLAASSTPGGALFDRSLMGGAVAFVSLSIVGLALIAALCDRRIKRAESALRDAVNSISEGFVIFDRGDRLVLCNEVYRRLYNLPPEMVIPGTSFEEIVRHVVACGGFKEGRNHESDLLADHMRRHRDPHSSDDYQMTNGSWILATDRRMNSGGIAGLRIDITALKQAQAALVESEARLDRAQGIAGIGSWELNIATGKYVWSQELYRIRGVSPDKFEPNVNNVAAYVHPDDYQEVRKWLDAMATGADQSTRETRIIRPDGEMRLLRVEGQPVRDPDGVIRRIAGTMQDITELRMIERQLSQAQKMEAIGSLTGGMAHDFNNGLGVIIGNLDLLGRMVREDVPAAEMCDEAREAALRCADLIKGLLAFARRQPLQARQTDVNVLVEGIVRLLGRTLGEDIEVRVNLEKALWPVMADAAQLEAALVNLATNARDAMPRGGYVDVTTKNVELDAHYASLRPEVFAGPYVLVEVSDTGQGIPPEIIGRVFEPFFTTKETGKGSGLGLSMVFGFVKQSGGHLDVYSEVGRGTTFRIYLPRATTNEAPVAMPAERRPMVGGTETILVVEDNTQLRRMALQQLGELGYRAIEAENAEVALHILGGDEKIELLFTDVVMPGVMDGYELANFARRLMQAPEVLLTSGFPAIRTPDNRANTTEFPLLGKPYRIDDLAHAVRTALDRARPREQGNADATRASDNNQQRHELATGEAV